MSFGLTLRSTETEIALTAEMEQAARNVSLTIPPLTFVPWGIIFRDFARLLYWFPLEKEFEDLLLDVFHEPFRAPDDKGNETCFRLEARPNNWGVELVVWQPSRPKEPALSLQERAAPLFLNLLALGLFHKDDPNFSFDLNALENEEVMPYHSELLRIVDEFHVTGLTPFWLSTEIQRIMVIARSHDLGIPIPEGIPNALVVADEAKVLRWWDTAEYERLFELLSELEQTWRRHYQVASKESPEIILALQNWIFVMNLFGFVHRFMHKKLLTQLPNPMVHLLNFLLEHFYITQWESNLWGVRRSALEETYRLLIPFLLT